MSWMKVTMSHEEADAGECDRIQGAFGSVFAAMCNPENAALFTNSPKTAECEFYFSPGAVKIFSAHLGLMNATVCDAPPRKGTISLVGNGDTHSMLR